MGGGDGQSDRKKKRKSRWATDDTVDKTIIPGMPTVLPSNLSKEQERQYICKFKVVSFMSFLLVQVGSVSMLRSQNYVKTTLMFCLHNEIENFLS